MKTQSRVLGALAVASLWALPSEVTACSCAPRTPVFLPADGRIPVDVGGIPAPSGARIYGYDGEVATLIRYTPEGDVLVPSDWAVGKRYLFEYGTRSEDLVVVEAIPQKVELTHTLDDPEYGDLSVNDNAACETKTPAVWRDVRVDVIGLAPELTRVSFEVDGMPYKYVPDGCALLVEGEGIEGLGSDRLAAFCGAIYPEQGLLLPGAHQVDAKVVVVGSGRVLGTESFDVVLSCAPPPTRGVEESDAGCSSTATFPGWGALAALGWLRRRRRGAG